MAEKSAIQIEIEGIQAVSDKMEQMVKDISGTPMVNGIREATLLVMRDARIFAPVDTGRLRASIAPEVRQQGNEVQGVVGSNVKYAPYMELGTGTFVGRKPHHPPSSALETWAKLHGIASGYLVARAIGMRGGLAPRRYLQRAFEKNKDKIVNLIGDVVGKIVKK